MTELYRDSFCRKTFLYRLRTTASEIRSSQFKLIGTKMKSHGRATVMIVLVLCVTSHLVTSSCPCRRKRRDCSRHRYRRAFDSCASCEKFVQRYGLNPVLVPRAKGSSLENWTRHYCRGSDPTFVSELTSCQSCSAGFFPYSAGVLYSRYIRTPHYVCHPCGAAWYPVLKTRRVGCECSFVTFVK